MGNCGETVVHNGLRVSCARGLVVYSISRSSPLTHTECSVCRTPVSAILSHAPNDNRLIRGRVATAELHSRSVLPPGRGFVHVACREIFELSARRRADRRKKMKFPHGSRRFVPVACHRPPLVTAHNMWKSTYITSHSLPLSCSFSLSLSCLLRRG